MSEEQPAEHDRNSLVTAVLGDGRPLLATVAVSLLFAGAFAIFLAARGEFLPHDIGYLGQTADELRLLADGRVVDFMLHDRAAWGGALMAIGLLYLWLVAVPLGRSAAILVGGLLATGAVLHAAGSRALWQAVVGGRGAGVRSRDRPPPRGGLHRSLAPRACVCRHCRAGARPGAGAAEQPSTRCDRARARLTSIPVRTATGYGPWASDHT